MPPIISVEKLHNSGDIDKNTKKSLVFLVWKLGINSILYPALIPGENKTWKDHIDSNSTISQTKLKNIYRNRNKVKFTMVGIQSKIRNAKKWKNINYSEKNNSLVTKNNQRRHVLSEFTRQILITLLHKFKKLNNDVKILTIITSKSNF